MGYRVPMPNTPIREVAITEAKAQLRAEFRPDGRPLTDAEFNSAQFYIQPDGDGRLYLWMDWPSDR